MSWKLIRVSSHRYDFHAPSGMLEYRPSQKYRIEKQNAFDPTFIHLREAYREDSFMLEAVLSPPDYDDLLYILTDSGSLYLEFESKQFPVTVKSLPACPDDLLQYPDIVKFTLESRYWDTPGTMDFSIFSLTDYDEIII